MFLKKAEFLPFYHVPSTFWKLKVSTSIFFHLQNILLLSGVSVPSLFSVVGDASQVDTLTAVIETGKILKLNFLILGNYNFEGFSAHVVASVIKHFFSELAEPLIPFAHYPSVTSWAGWHFNLNIKDLQKLMIGRKK
jgi:hypothetical protein